MTTTTPTLRSRVRACFLGGTIGDALGAPVEFWNSAQIFEACGPAGVTSYLPMLVDGEERFGLITDDTQMTLFAAEGLIRASQREERGIGFTVAVTHSAFDRWLDTQMLSAPSGERNGWLIQQQWLYARRAPGSTCLSALMDAREGKARIRSYGSPVLNDSKGCGGVMRSAPFGLMAGKGVYSLRELFDAAALSASYTHGHITGQLASGALAACIAALMGGDSLSEAIAKMLALLAEYPGHEETLDAVQKAVAAAHNPPSVAVVESLGGGWVAEEALAIAVYAALVYPGADQVLQALSLAVTHSGDSDSTGAICGNILGALHGEEALPNILAFAVEGRGTILELADDFSFEFDPRAHLSRFEMGRAWNDRYPGD